ncbi:MAG TPA: hypothetical protein VFL96_14705 [Acidobacteriaceae bacterium]|jgi:hypothetical protein|nr:hypothetical protein [Acidobacteriaceae bacterium]
MAEVAETKTATESGEHRETRGRDDGARKGHATMRPSATQEDAQQTGEGIERTAEIADSSIRQLADHQRALWQTTVRQVEAFSHQMRAASLEAAENVCQFMSMPTPDFRSIQDSASDLFRGMTQTNFRAAQEFIRLSEAALSLEIQQRHIQNYMAAMMQGACALIRATRETTEQTLHPIEEQSERRRQRIDCELRRQQAAR